MVRALCAAGRQRSPGSGAGIRLFVVGTGGADLERPVQVKANSEVRGTDWGVLKLTLGDKNYQWEFVPVDGATFRDAGSGACH